MEWRLVQLPYPYTHVFEISDTGILRNVVTGTIMAGSDTSKGYKQYLLQWKGKRITRKAHRLVAEAFIPNPNNKLQVNHKDTNKKNNNVNNLEWCTNQENHNHKMANGLNVNLKGEQNGRSILKINQIKEIRKLLSGGVQGIEVAKQFKVHPATISAIKTNKIWRDI